MKFKYEIHHVLKANGRYDFMFSHYIYDERGSHEAYSKCLFVTMYITYGSIKLLKKLSHDIASYIHI